MNELRGAIKDLRNVARRLDAATFNPDMSAIKKFVEELGDKEFTVTPPQDVRQKALEKFLRGDYNFMRRELRSLPFIIYEREITIGGVKKILTLLDLSNKRHLSGLVNVYLNQYDDSAKTELLRQRLSFIPTKFTEDSTRLKKIFASKYKLFADNSMANMVSFLAQKLSVENALEELGLTNFYKTSNFIQESLKNFFQRPFSSLADQFKLLEELDSEFDTYKNIFPAIADALIQTVHRAGHGKKKCLEVFYKRLGDPRFGDRRFSWDRISEQSKKIFCAWIAEDDLRIFFEITREALNEALKRAIGIAARAVASNNLDMWNERETFWRAYMPSIGNTWVVLGKNAQEIAYRLEDRRTHGRLLGNQDADKSGFLFQIDGYIFGEWSHNGALRVYQSPQVKDYIGHSFTKKKMMDEKYLYRQPHRDSRDEDSDEIVSWQNKVSKWLKDSCGIVTTEKDWGGIRN